MENIQKGRLWVRIMKRHRVERDAMIECRREDVQEALRELLPKLDISQPMWLKNHLEDWENYSMTRFRPEHFLETVDFDSMELSYIAPEGSGKPPRKRNILEDV